MMPSLQMQPKYAKEVNQTIYEEFQEDATLGQQSNPSHAEHKHQTTSNNNLEIWDNRATHLMLNRNIKLYLPLFLLKTVQHCFHWILQCQQHHHIHHLSFSYKEGICRILLL